ncbi:MAG: Tim44 domain-containing protein [Proteobacteria bacterium]|nr:Tim44 domain-containing protein [Pseudomonadota bacterium]
MDDVQFLDIIFFAMVAAFLVLRLRSVLGRRTGHERQRHDPRLSPRTQPGEAEAAEPPPALEAPAGEAPAGEGEAETKLSDLVAAGLTRLRLADRTFDPERFLDGARSAFEIIIAAFAAGDRATLRALLSDDVFRDFESAIAARERGGQSLKHTLVGMTSAEIVGAEVKGSTGVVTVKFVSDQINLMHDAEGKVVAGTPEGVTSVTDVWTFTRDSRSRDPNWMLAATRSPD